MSSETTPAGPQVNPAEISSWPMLKLSYATDTDKIAAVLPPGIEPIETPHVHLTIYNVPIQGEPELGVVTTVDAAYKGTPGLYALGYGIDQESAIFISQEMNGQPKYPCAIRYFRLGDQVEARCTHQGYTFAEFSGQVTRTVTDVPNHVEDEWWIKCSRAVGMMPNKTYDLPPAVVRVHSSFATAFQEEVEGTLTLSKSPWDPIAERLPMREQVSSYLWTPTFLGREITVAGKLDPDAYWPYSDTIGGSRWLGNMGGPAEA